MPDQISWVSQVFGMPHGFAGMMWSLDLDSGRRQQKLFRLTGRGDLLGIRDVEQAGARLIDRLEEIKVSDSPNYGSILAAAAGVSKVRKSLKDFPAELRRKVQSDVLQLVCTGRWLWLLESDSHHLQAEQQRLLRIDLDRTTDLKADAVDLGALSLGGARVITMIARLGATLIVAVSDPLRGLELYRLDEAAKEPDFDLLMDRGALRYSPNAAVSAVGTGPGGELLLGTAALAHTPDVPVNWGPELIALRSDGTWDLVFGMPRMTPWGLKRPRSGKRAGLDNPANAAVRAIATGKGPNGRQMTCVAIQGFAGKPVQDRRQAAPDLMAYAGDLRLFASYDLKDWVSLTDGLERAFGAVTCMSVTPRGVLVGHEGEGSRQVPAFLVRHASK